MVAVGGSRVRVRLRNDLRRAGAYGGLAFAIVSLPAGAQEAIRMSLAGEASAEARRRAATSFNYYNLKLGPVAWRFEASAGVQYHDNITYSQYAPKSDFILRPQLDTAMRWTLTERNTLNLNFGVGYLKYLKYPEYDRFNIDPNSEIGFDLYVGDFLFNVHDRVGIRTDAGEIPMAVSQGNYQRFENIAGVATHWDLNTLILSAGYDHADYVSLNSVLRLADGSSEIVFARGSVSLSSESTIGPEVGVTSVDYTDVRVSDAIQYSAGAFYQSRLSAHIEGRVRAGYTYYVTETNPLMADKQYQGNVYGDLSLSHRVSDWMTHSVAVGHQVRTGLEYGSRTRPLTVTYANWNPSWRFLHEFQLTSPMSFQYGEEEGGLSEQFTYWSVGVNLSRMLSSKLSGRISYRFLAKDSNLRGGDYAANIVSLIFRYRF